MNEEVKIDYHPWHPIKDPITLKHLGKLAEELGECSAAVARCIIQGINERDPVTQKLNYDWLEEEIADVAANCELVAELLKFSFRKMHDRKWAKKDRLKAWHRMA